VARAGARTLRKPRVSQNAGSTTARILACEKPEPMSEAKRASLLELVALIDGAC